LIKVLRKSKWISVIADDYRKGKPDYDLYLSWDYYQRSSFYNKLFLDGGVPQLVVGKSAHYTTKSEFNILYSGSINKWTGIENFIERFADENLEDAILHVYGYINKAQKLRYQTDRYNNVIFYGFVDESVLKAGLKNADVFIDPRNTDLKETSNNFPSKLLLYLAHEKPILSTMAAGISPALQEILIDLNKYSLAQIRDLIYNEEFQKENVRITKEYKSNHSWPNLTCTLMEKVEGNV
jgi:hypothetical protein